MTLSNRDDEFPGDDFSYICPSCGWYLPVDETGLALVDEKTDAELTACPGCAVRVWIGQTPRVDGRSRPDDEIGVLYAAECWSCGAYLVPAVQLPEGHAAADPQCSTCHASEPGACAACLLAVRERAADHVAWALGLTRIIAESSDRATIGTRRRVIRQVEECLEAAFRELGRGGKAVA